MKTYCTQNNGDCATCSLVNYGRDCQNNPVSTGAMSSLKHKNMMEAYDGFGGPRTIEAIKEFIPEELFTKLTGRQLGLVMSTVNKAYHAGKASTGAEMIDSNAVWVNGLERAIEWVEEGAEYEQVEEDLGGGRKRIYSRKTKDGKLVARFVER